MSTFPISRRNYNKRVTRNPDQLRRADRDPPSWLRNRNHGACENSPSPPAMATTASGITVTVHLTHTEVLCTVTVIPWVILRSGVAPAESPFPPHTGHRPAWCINQEFCTPKSPLIQRTFFGAEIRGTVSIR